MCPLVCETLKRSPSVEPAQKHEIRATDFSNDVELFNSTGNQYTGWNPTVVLTSVTYTRGATYKLSGFKFNGASQDATYGDYAKTHDDSTMAVGYVGPSFTFIDIPSSMPAGGYQMQMLVNGIVSQSYPVGIN